MLEDKLASDIDKVTLLSEKGQSIRSLLGSSRLELDVVGEKFVEQFVEVL